MGFFLCTKSAQSGAKVCPKSARTMRTQDPLLRRGVFVQGAIVPQTLCNPWQGIRSWRRGDRRAARLVIA